VLFCTFVLGLMLTRLGASDYLSAPGTWRHLLGSLTLLRIDAPLPGVFEDNAMRTVNGSLWTLPGELEMYAYVVLFGLLGAYRARWRFACLLGALSAIALWRPPMLRLVSHADFYPLAAFFAFGALCWVYRERVVLSGAVLLALVAACVALYDHPAYPWVFGAATAYGALWLAYTPVLQGFNRAGDYSYGVYLYGFPCQQLVAHAWPGAGPWRMLALALPLALGCAIVSWHCIEQPFLRLKPKD
jgi:peptidoglycan/LPS O-acetylase OafA/YrhL